MNKILSGFLIMIGFIGCDLNKKPPKEMDESFRSWAEESKFSKEQTSNIWIEMERRETLRRLNELSGKSLYRYPFYFPNTKTDFSFTLNPPADKDLARIKGILNKP